MKQKNYSKHGFTLVEVMIVMVIIGLMSTFIVPRIMDRPEQARRLKAQADIKSIESALHLFKTDTGQYPTTSQGLEALVTDPGIRGYNPGGYLDRVPVDPWGNDYVYISPGREGRDYDLESFGRDGQDGGTGPDANIQSWNLQ